MARRHEAYLVSQVTTSFPILAAETKKGPWVSHEFLKQTQVFNITTQVSYNEDMKLRRNVPRYVGDGQQKASCHGLQCDGEQAQMQNKRGYTEKKRAQAKQVTYDII